MRKKYPDNILFLYFVDGFIKLQSVKACVIMIGNKQTKGEKCSIIFFLIFLFKKNLQMKKKKQDKKKSFSNHFFFFSNKFFLKKKERKN